MTCSEALDLMLTADPDELLGRGEGEVEGEGNGLAAHLSACPNCADAARVLRANLGVLAGAVERRAKRRAAFVVGIPAAAAAVVVGVFLTGSGDDERVPQRLPETANVVSVDVSAGQHATVIKTSDPKVTVVWISSGDSK